MKPENSNFLTPLHVLLGYLAVATLTVNMWVIWLSQGNTSTPIGLSLAHMVLSVTTFALGVFVVVIHSFALSRNKSASLGQKNILAISTCSAAVLVVLASVATGWNLLTGPAEGFFDAGLGNGVSATLWGLSMVALWIWLFSVTVVIRQSSKLFPKT